MNSPSEHMLSMFILSTNRPSFGAADQAEMLKIVTNERVVQVGRVVAGQFGSRARCVHALTVTKPSPQPRPDVSIAIGDLQGGRCPESGLNARTRSTTPIRKISHSSIGAYLRWIILTSACAITAARKPSYYELQDQTGRS